MRIGYNAQLLSYRHWYRSAGISRYIDRTLRHLAPYLHDDSCVAFVGPDVPDDAPPLQGLLIERTHLPTTRPLARIMWEQMVLPALARRWRVDVLHLPAYVAPLLPGPPSVVTYHDLSFFRLPGAFNRSNRTYLQLFSRLSARRAERFIAVSESTRQDMVTLLGIGPERIDVVYNGVDQRFQPVDNPGDLERFRASQGLPDRFLLYLGTLEPRKNVVALIRAYAAARRQGISEPLILAGGRGWGGSPEADLIEQLDLGGSVRAVGFVPMEEQSLWYNAATLFVYPSLYEGFGLPVLEAMACGTPVVTSNLSSLPEVVGDAGLLVDPRDPDVLAEALVAALRNDELRRDLSQRGRARAQKFSWDASVNATLSTYRQVLAQRSMDRLPNNTRADTRL